MAGGRHVHRLGGCRAHAPGFRMQGAHSVIHQHAGVDGAGPLTLSTGGEIRSGRALYRLVAIVTAILMAFGGLALVAPVATADSGEQVRTTDRLKLRAGPALNSEILDVMEAGDPVEITGEPENGFYPVAWNGQPGWAYSAYLTTGAADGGPVTTGGQQGEVNVADGPVNFRTGPSMADSVISVIPDGALVALNGDSANGFLGIIYTDRSGWAHAESVLGDGAPAVPEVPVAPETPAAPEAPAAPASPGVVPVGETVTGSAVVVDGGLNLRTGPSLDNPVVTVMPDGSPVELRGDIQNGFAPVSFNGETGWASIDFLGAPGQEPAAPEAPAATEPPVETPVEPGQPAPPAPTEPPAPAPTEPPAEPAAPPVDGGDGWTEDEIIQIIYAAADRYGQPREDMLRVARCESVLDPTAVNASSNASGLFQFLPSTWATTPYADQDIFDPVANANAAGWMWAEGRRNEWTCQ
jgi:uncharacterized protein YraI